MSAITVTEYSLDSGSMILAVTGASLMPLRICANKTLTAPPLVLGDSTGRFRDHLTTFLLYSCILLSGQLSEGQLARVEHVVQSSCRSWEHVVSLLTAHRLALSHSASASNVEACHRYRARTSSFSSYPASDRNLTGNSRAKQCSSLTKRPAHRAQTCMVCLCPDSSLDRTIPNALIAMVEL